MPWEQVVSEITHWPVSIVLVTCWKVAKNCQKSKKVLPKFQKLLPKFLDQSHTKIKESESRHNRGLYVQRNAKSVGNNLTLYSFRS